MGSKPLALDLFCGLGGWAEGLLAAGWAVIGVDFDPRFIGRYPGQLVIHDVMNLCCRKMRGRVRLVVASPDCREPSYRAMPWSRAKKLNVEGPPHNFIRMFNRCFEIADEIGCPVIVENVKGAQPWVGRAKWHCGPYFLWGNVPLLMPIGEWRKGAGSGRSWFYQNSGNARSASSGSEERKEWTAQVSKIPFDIAYHVGQVFHAS